MTMAWFWYDVIVAGERWLLWRECVVIRLIARSQNLDSIQILELVQLMQILPPER